MKRFKFAVAFMGKNSRTNVETILMDIIEASNLDEAVGIFIKQKDTSDYYLGAWRAIKIV